MSALGQGPAPCGCEGCQYERAQALTLGECFRMLLWPTLVGVVAVGMGVLIGYAASR